jgi:hypothetical protein
MCRLVGETAKMVNTRSGRKSCTRPACAFDILCIPFRNVLEVRCMRFDFYVLVFCVALNWNYRILECSDQKALSFQAVQALLNKFLPCIPVKDVEDKLFQYVLPSAKQLFNEVIYSSNLCSCNVFKSTVKLIVLFTALPFWWYSIFEPKIVLQSHK